MNKMNPTTTQTLRGLAEIVAILGISLGGTLLCVKGLTYWDRHIIQEQDRAAEQKAYAEINRDPNDPNYHLYTPTTVYEK